MQGYVLTVVSVPKDPASPNKVAAQENHRREIARKSIERKPEQERTLAQAEENEAIARYERERAETLTALGLTEPKEFRCFHRGCMTAPYRSQRLLEYGFCRVPERRNNSDE